jgi:Tyrosine phosphatase family
VTLLSAGQYSHGVAEGARSGASLRAAAGVLALAVALVGLWIVHTFVWMENLHEVVPGDLYRSGQPRPEQLSGWIEELKLQAVLRLKEDGATAEPEREVLDERGVELLSVRLSGQRPPTRAELLSLLDALEGAPRPLLVHCDAGADRTGLATALALLLEGRSPSEARNQFGVRYRHFGALFGSPLSAVLDQYAQWLAGSGALHTPERLRAWVRYVYVPLYYLAQIEVSGLPPVIPAGQPLHLDAQVTNASGMDLPLASDPHRGAALGAVLSSHGDQVWWAESGEGPLAPGETREVSLELPALAPGAYELRLDLAEADRSGDLRWFQRMGSTPFRAWLSVAERRGGSARAAPGSGPSLPAPESR